MNNSGINGEHRNNLLKNQKNNRGQTTFSCFIAINQQGGVMKRMLLALGAISTVVVAGCTSTQITKVAQVESEEICIVDNPRERPAFRDAYERTIQAKGYKTRVVSDAKDCRVNTTYSSSMGWSGWGPYLSDADLQIFSGDKLVGRAIYHAKKVPTSNGSFESKISALVDQMLPQSKGSASQ